MTITLNEYEIKLLNNLLQENITYLDENVWDISMQDCHEKAMQYALSIQIMEKLK